MNLLRLFSSLWIVFFLSFQMLTAQNFFQLIGADQPEMDPIQIVEDVCLGDGIEVVDIEFEGVDAAVGTFTNGDMWIGLDEGLIMTTGWVNSAGNNIGADEDVQMIANVFNMSTASYPLEDLANSEIQFDVAVYRITFIPTNDSIRFNYVFSSDEYPEFVCSPFNDVFGFFLEGPDADGNIQKENLAVIPGTDLPVSINTINPGVAGSDTSTAEEEYCTEPTGSLNYTDLYNNTFQTPTYNGYTDVLMAKAEVIPCQTYTIEWVIADIGDQLWDSGVFIEANSFCSFGAEPTASIQASDKVILVEGCSHAPLTVDLSNLEEADFPLTYTISGDADNGADFEEISLNGEIPFGEDTWELSLNTLDDGLPEGVEQLNLLLEAECFSQNFNICIIDPLTIEGDAVGECSNDPFTLQVVADYDTSELPDDWAVDFEFSWSTGANGPSIEVVPTENTTYTLTYSSPFNDGCEASFDVDVINPEGVLSTTLCMEDPGIMVNGTLYNFDNPVGTEVIEGASQSGCDSIVQIMLSFYPSSIQLLDISINEGEIYEIDEQEFAASGTYEVILSDQNGCDSTIILNLLIETSPETIIDTLIVGEEEEFCFDVSIFNTVNTFELYCGSSSEVVDALLDSASYCIGYEGLNPGLDTLCVEICDDLGICDTTFFELWVFTNLLDAVDDFDTTLVNESTIVDVLANDWTSATTLTDQYLVNQPAYGVATLNNDGTVTYSPSLSACLVEDQFSYAICNEIGCDTATVNIWLQDAEDLCDGVWPGDVGDDGLVNQLDFWAVGLAFVTEGPTRPNASIEWFGQPMIDWGETITFIYEIDLKYADCNGDGSVDEGDYEAIDQNWGLTHNLQAQNYETNQSDWELSLGNPQFNSLNQLLIPVNLGTADKQLKDFYGLAFEINCIECPEAAQFELDESWIGTNGNSLYSIQKRQFTDNYIVLVRNDQVGKSGFGQIGYLVLNNYSEQLNIQIDKIEVLTSNAEIFSLPGVTTSLDVVSSIDQLSGNEGINVQVFPNPANDFVWLKWNELLELEEIHIMDVRGSHLKTLIPESNVQKLNTTSLKPGVYFVKMRIKDQWVVQKLLIQ